MINRAVLVGRLTRDPEIRYTQGGTAVVGFTLAVNRQFTNSQGEREADFVNCVIWRKAAENFANFTHKGSLVGIDGHIQTRNYDNQQGQRVYVTEVIVDNFSLLESRSESEKRSSGNGSNNSDSNQAPNYNQQNQSNQTSYGNNNSQSNNNNNNNQSNNSNNNMGDPFADNSKPIDISDDDLPF